MKNKKLFAILTLVCFMFTLMPVAAFATTDADVQQSWIYVDDAKVKVNKNATLTYDLNANTTTESLYVWFEETENVPSTALVGGPVKAVTVPAGQTDAEIEVQFSRAGVFELHAATVDPTGLSGATTAEKVAAAADYELKTDAAYKTITVSTDAADSNDYALVVSAPVTAVGGEIADNEKGYMGVVLGDGAYTEAVSLKLIDKGNGDASVYAPDVKIDTTSGVEVTNVEVKRSGIISFDVTANKAGTHKIYISVDAFKATIEVNANTGEADSIEAYAVAKTPQNKAVADLQVLVDPTYGSLASAILFKVYDVNGNEITWDNVSAAPLGMNGAINSSVTANYRNYVALLEKPADSDLTSEDFTVGYYAGSNGAGWTVVGDYAFDAEGKYTFKVVLDNGASATASITVLDAEDPTALSISYNTDSVQLGATIAPKAVGYLDKNYTFTNAVVGRDYEFVATGAAVEDVTGNVIKVKDDEKYVGSTIKVTVVDETNNLIATTTLTVAEEAKDLVFDTTVVPVDMTRTITVKLVDENGKSVGLDTTTADAYVVVMDKPADAAVDTNVTVVNATKGLFQFTFDADVAGVYEVQAVMKATVNNVVRYYTGVQEIKVGATGIEDTVVMSINASQIVVNDKVVAIDAAPMIKDSRTFVPFRALAEAFGATVEFDAATQAVVAELDGTKVVMTIGDKAYTVNGVAKAADVAPFISDSRTMVPVRFVAEAFGITVTPIAAEDGSIADVLFTK